MSQQPAQRQRSILEDLGEEVTAIITPVSICMALTVMLVKTLNPTGASDVHSVLIASAFYTEQVGALVGTIVNEWRAPGASPYTAAAFDMDAAI